MDDSLRLAETNELAAHYEVAAQHAQAALAQARREARMGTMAHAHKLLGDIDARQGRPKNAREHYAAALHACQRASALPV
jgi:hypothetical protein